MVFVDDSHATGFIGPNGRGVHEHFGVVDKIDVLTTTFGKALGGASGGARRQGHHRARRRRPGPLAEHHPAGTEGVVGQPAIVAERAPVVTSTLSATTTSSGFGGPPPGP